MNTFISLAAHAVAPAASTAPVPALPTAAWDVVSFFENAAEFIKTAGGGFLIAVGIAALVWGAFLGLRKLMSGQQNQDNWMKIIALIIVGGAVAVGGFGLVFTIGSGGKTTIEDLGGATIFWSAGSLLGLA